METFYSSLSCRRLVTLDKWRRARGEGNLIGGYIFRSRPWSVSTLSMSLTHFLALYLKRFSTEHPMRQICNIVCVWGPLALSFQFFTSQSIFVLKKQSDSCSTDFTHCELYMKTKHVRRYGRRYGTELGRTKWENEFECFVVQSLKPTSCHNMAFDK